MSQYSSIVIVGAQENKWTPTQKIIARERIYNIIFNNYLKYTKLPILERSEIFTVISGHCPYGGVDIWVEEIMKDNFHVNVKNITMLIISPEVHQWNDKNGQMGYKSRNIKMAEIGDIIYDIEPKGNWSGGTWTAEYAHKLGKETHKIEINNI